MGRRKSAKELENQLKYAKAREAYSPPQREADSATQRRPRNPVKYAVLSPLAEADAAFTIQVSTSGLEFFGGIGALGLVAPGTDPGPPRGFRPAEVKAMVSDSTSALIRAKGSNRPYIRYGKGSRGSNSQYNFSAAITDTTPTGLDSKVKALFVAKKGSLGGAYGRIWFESERYPLNGSG